MKHLIAVLLSVVATTSNAASFEENPWCDVAVKATMKGWDAAKAGKPVNDLISIQDQQQRLLAIQGYIAQKDGVKKPEAYLYFMQLCLSHNAKAKEEQQEERI